jgi:hypothetical protein
VAVWVLVHSPLVGPATWRGAAAELRRRGRPVEVPQLTPPVRLSPPYTPTHATEVVAAVRGSGHGGDNLVVLAGHSGAGPRLPAIGAALARAGFPVGAYVFVDAGLPVAGHTPRDEAPAGFSALLDSLTDRHGLLPRWSEWFGPDAEATMSSLVPDPVERASIAAELQPVPAAWFDEPITVPDGWPGGAACGYVSFTYADEADEAMGSGWGVVDVDAGHLHMAVDPAAVVDAMLTVAGSYGA